MDSIIKTNFPIIHGIVTTKNGVTLIVASAENPLLAQTRYARNFYPVSYAVFRKDEINGGWIHMSIWYTRLKNALNRMERLATKIEEGN